jgi:hypothetical protein
MVWTESDLWKYKNEIHHSNSEYTSDMVKTVAMK